ncbi:MULTISPECIES: hypothetical protein [Nocardioides]|uniref:hypothetical protein n=1 Tax=Nocardioides TaxID=1839 RepID=UPI0012EA6BD1|nr:MULTISPECIES: hypothetical protein [Nocardioides]MCM3517050.1 hypothetical protein [Nocardioides sp. P86]
MKEMYNNPAVVSGGGVLAATGLGAGMLWMFLAAFALLALGLAVLRTVPRAER